MESDVRGVDDSFAFVVLANPNSSPSILRLVIRPSKPVVFPF